MKTKLRAKDVSVSKTIHGYHPCSAVVRGYYYERNYIGHSKREAVRMFVSEMNGEKP